MSVILEITRQEVGAVYLYIAENFRVVNSGFFIFGVEDGMALVAMHVTGGNNGARIGFYSVSK